MRKPQLTKSGTSSYYCWHGRDECQEQNKGHRRGTKRGKDSSFCDADGPTPTQELEAGAEVPKCKGRVVLQGEVVKDDSGSYAVFTEQRSSASQMTAAKVVDVIARLFGCAGQPCDAVSAYTQCRREDAPTLLKLSKSERPDIWIRFPRHKWPKKLQSIQDLVVPLEGHRYGRSLAGLHWEAQFEKVLLGIGWEKRQPGNVCLCIGSKVNSCQCTWTTTHGWKEAEFGTHGERIDGTRSSG